MKKKLLSFFLCMCMVLSLLPVPTASAVDYSDYFEVKASSIQIENAAWVLTKTPDVSIRISGGHLTEPLKWVYISGSGEVGLSLDRFTDEIKDVHIIVAGDSNIVLRLSKMYLDPFQNEETPVRDTPCISVGHNTTLKLLLGGDIRLGSDNCIAGRCGIGLAESASLIIEDDPNASGIGSLSCYGGPLSTYTSTGGAGIGSLANNSGHGQITVNSGVVRAYGAMGCAGIGGVGGDYYGGNLSRNGGNLTINGGSVTAVGGSGAAAVGGAAGRVIDGNDTYGHGGHVVVNGGNLIAKAYNNSDILSKSGYVKRTGKVIGTGANAPNAYTTKENGEYVESLTVRGGLVTLSSNVDSKYYQYFPMNVESEEEEAEYIESHFTNCVIGYNKHSTNTGAFIKGNTKIVGNARLTSDYTIANDECIVIPDGSTLTVDGCTLTIEERGVLSGRTNSMVLENGGKVAGTGYRPAIITLVVPDIPFEAPDSSVEAEKDRMLYLAVVESRNSSNKRLIAERSSAELAAAVGSDDLLTIITAGSRGFEEIEDGYRIAVDGIKTINLAFTGNGCLTGASVKNTAVFEIKQDGNSVTATGTDISLCSAYFAMFSPKNGTGFTMDFSSEDDMSAGKLALTAEFNPTDNNAFMTLPELFGSSFMIDSISPVKNSKSMRFAGKLAISTPVVDIAGIEISKLQLNFSGALVRLEGIAGSGKVDIPKIGGFIGGKAETRINTFLGEGTDEAEFMFEVQAKTPVFDGEFYLDFAEAYGVLLPNSFYMAGKVGTQGIPLVPPTTVAYITGGGLGIYGLAETIGMKRVALPPIRLRLTGSGSIVDVMEGTMDLTVGPGYSNIELSDIEIADAANVLSKVGVVNSFNLEQFKYRGIVYDVVALRSRMYMEAGLELAGVEFLEADGSVSFAAMTGLSVDTDSRNVHGLFRLESAGELGGSLKIPKGAVFGLPPWDFNFADVRVGYNLSGTYAPVVPFDSPMDALDGEAMMKATKLTGAIAAKANFNVLFTSLWARVGYVLGGSPSIDGGFGDGPELFSMNASEQKPTFTYAEAVDNEKRDGDYTFVQVNAKVVADTSKQMDEADMALMGVIGETPSGVSLAQNGSDEKRYTATVNSDVINPNQIMFVMTGKNNTPLTADDIFISTPEDAVELIEPVPDADDNDYDGNTTEQANNANFAIDDDGVAYFTAANGEPHIIQSEKAIDIQAVRFTPFATLNSTDTALTDNNAEYSIDNYNEDSEYALKVYLSETEGDTEHLIAEQDISDVEGELAIPKSGVEAPSGNYYVTAVLMEKATIATENGNVSSWVIADTKSLGGSFDYEYTGKAYATVAAPESATLAYAGNETLTASWDAVDGAEGYQIRVYDKDGNFTGIAYQTTTETELTMALTLDGKGPKGQTISGLASDADYSVGVSAFKNVGTTLDMPDGNDDVEVNSQVFSEEKMSGKVTLRQAKSPVLRYSSNVVHGGYAQHTLMIGATQSHSFTVNASDDCTITVRNITDPTKPILASAENVKSLEVDDLDFIGSVQLEVLAVKSDGDYALEYITTRLDDIAPVISLDNGGTFYKSADADCKITGKTEAEALVCAWDDTSAAEPVKVAQADDNGDFALLLGEGEYIIEALDLVENRSEALKAKVAVSNTVTPDKATYELRSGADVSVTLTPSGSLSLTELRLGDKVLTAGVDYSVSENTYTLNEDVLDALEEGSYLLTFDMSDGNDPQVLLNVTPKGKSQGGSSSFIGTYVSAPKANGVIDIGGGISATAKVTNGIAELSFDSAKLLKLLEESAISGKLSIDLTSLSESVSGARLNETDWKAISTAVNDTENTISGLDLKFDTGSVAFDGKAMTAASTAGGKVTVRISPTDKSRLTARQAFMMTDRPLVDITVKCGDTQLTELGGGSLDIALPYVLGKDEQSEFLAVWHLNEDAQPEAYQCKYDGKQVSFTLNHLSVYAVAYFPFTDVAIGSWYYGDAAWSNIAGIMSGVGDNRFAPQADTDRAMIVTMLHRMMEEPTATGASRFDDVAAGKYYERAVLWAAENGVVGGYGNGRFGPEDKITREQLATILYRYAKLTGGDTAQSGTELQSYDDYGLVSEYAAEAMAWAVSKGLLQGNGNRLMPRDKATRAQVAAILHRFCDNIATPEAQEKQ